MKLAEALALLAAKDEEIALLRAQLTSVQKQLDALLELSAGQNQRLGELADMMRRRLQRAPPRPPGDEPEDDPPSGGAAGGSSPLELDAGPRSRRRPGRKPGQGRRHSGRNELPAHLPVDEERHCPESCAHCGSEHLLARDEEVVEKLDVVKAHLRRRCIRREVKVCTHCRKTTTAPMPPMPFERSSYTNEFLAWLVVMKFVLLVPLDRIRRMLASQGLDLSEGTLVSMMERASDMLGPIDGQHWKELKAGLWMAFDGTGLKTLVEGMPRAWLGNLDVFNRGATTVYQFSMTKHGDELAAKLRDFRGTLLCDAESRHNELFVGERPEANCNAHPRRKFRDASKAQPQLAPQAGAFLTALYDVERQARKQGLSGEELLAMRQALSRPISDDFRSWLQRIQPQLLPSDPLGKAVRYYLRHYDGLARFIDDADLPIDNNLSERAFQNHAKLRLNALFAGSPEGAHRWATILGVVTTAQRLGLDVFAYLTWAFDRRGTWKGRFGLTAAQLTPAAYKKDLEEKLARTAVA